MGRRDLRLAEPVDLGGEGVHDRLHLLLGRLCVRTDLLPGRVHGLRDNPALVGARLADALAGVPADVLDHLLDHQLSLAEHLDDLFVHAVAGLLVLVQLRLHALQLRPPALQLGLAALELGLETFVPGPALAELPLRDLYLIS